jgi:hypothetical protein
LDGVKPFHGLAGLPGVVRMCPLGLDRLVELAARMGHAADEHDVGSQADGVVTVRAIHLQIASVAVEEPEGHRLTSGGIVVEENDGLMRGTTAPHPEIGVRMRGLPEFLQDLQGGFIHVQDVVAE